MAKASGGPWALAVKIIAAFIATLGLIMGAVYFVNSKVDKTEYRPAMQAVEDRKLERNEWQIWRDQDQLIQAQEQQIQDLMIERLEALADEHGEFERRPD
jgi:hypothetical protein